MDRVLTKLQSTNPELNRMQDRLLQVLNPVLKRALLVAERYTTATRPQPTAALAGTFIRVRDTAAADEVLQVCLQDDTGAWVWSALAPGAIGPKGDKGDTGDKGDKGDKGDTGDPGTVPAAQVSLSADQTAEPGDTVAFDTRDVDPGGLQDGTTIVVPSAGTYRVHAEFEVSDLAAGSWARAVLDVNTSAVYRSPTVYNSPSAAVSMDYLIDLASADVVSIGVDSSDSSFTVEAGAVFAVVGVPVAS